MIDKLTFVNATHPSSSIFLTRMYAPRDHRLRRKYSANKRGVIFRLSPLSSTFFSRRSLPFMSRIFLSPARSCNERITAQVTTRDRGRRTSISRYSHSFALTRVLNSRISSARRNVSRHHTRRATQRETALAHTYMTPGRVDCPMISKHIGPFRLHV